MLPPQAANDAAVMARGTRMETGRMASREQSAGHCPGPFSRAFRRSSMCRLVPSQVAVSWGGAPRYPGAAPMNDHVDVLIVGAGLSGIAAGVHLKTHCPQKT